MKSSLIVCLFSGLLVFGWCLDSAAVTKDDFSRLEQTVQDLTRDVRFLLSFMARITETPELNDTTIEERVAVLEYQVSSINDDITTINDDVTNLTSDLEAVEDEVTVISSEQILQDERILELEIDSDSFEDSITALETVDDELASAVVAVENKVTAVNFSLSEAIDGLDDELTLLEEMFATLDNRVSKLELSGIVAFQVDLDTYTTIPEGSVVIFEVVDLNLGGGYNSATGEFTVPSGGAGLYFFYVNFFADDERNAAFTVRVNGEWLCYAYGEMNNSPGDNATPSCGALITLIEGDVVDVYYEGGTDDTPVNSDTRPYNTFTGFRIAPE